MFLNVRDRSGLPHTRSPSRLHNKVGEGDPLAAHLSVTSVSGSTVLLVGVTENVGGLRMSAKKEVRMRSDGALSLASV